MRALVLAASLALPAAGQAWSLSGRDAVRGVTIGPIENAYHPGVGYGSSAYERSVEECASWGASWVAITPFGRVNDLSGAGVDPTFEAPFEKNREQVIRAIRMAHERGMHVMLVPHLWVESGAWRAEIDPKTTEGWSQWARSYGDFVVAWARVAEETHAEIFSAGVELRSWVTSGRAPTFLAVLDEVRRAYHGLSRTRRTGTTSTTRSSSARSI